MDSTTIHSNEIMKKKRIAVFANGWSNEFVSYMLEGIRKEAAKEGVDIFFYTEYIFYGDSPMQNKCQLNIFHLPNPEDFDGAIMLTNTFNIPGEQERILNLFGRAGVPIIGTEVKTPGVAYIGSNNEAGMKLLCEHILDKHNVKKVVYVAGIEGNEECAIRKKVLLDALHERGLELMDSFHGRFSFYSASETLKKWLDDGNTLPDAFVCANDHMALAVISVLHERGYEVPKDTIVTGFDHIVEARKSIPMLATVTRCWETLGNNAYLHLREQIECHNPDFEIEYDSAFVPSESCGCEPTEEEKNTRLDSFRSSYHMANKADMLDIFCQQLGLEMSKVESKEELCKGLNRLLSVQEYLGPDFSICTEPSFFELDDEEYPKRIRGYGKQMDVVFEKCNGVCQEAYSFSTVENAVPHYKKVNGQSNLYIIVPLNYMEYIIGYIAIKNSTNMLYDLSLRKFVANLNSVFVTARQYIFAQRTNRKLKEIYMTDFLTGMYNRTGVESVLFEYIQKAKEKGETSLLMFSDIDCMKTINDVYGHLNGDIAIKAISGAMRKALPEDWLFGRYGGDEFVAVGNCPDENSVAEFRESVSSNMVKIINSYKLKFDLSASVGHAIIRPMDDGTIEDYIRIADQSMYEEKKRAHEIIRARHMEDNK